MEKQPHELVQRLVLVFLAHYLQFIQEAHLYGGVDNLLNSGYFIHLRKLGLVKTVLNKSPLELVGDINNFCL